MIMLRYPFLVYYSYVSIFTHENKMPCGWGLFFKCNSVK